MPKDSKKGPTGILGFLRDLKKGTIWIPKSEALEPGANVLATDLPQARIRKKGC